MIIFLIAGALGILIYFTSNKGSNNQLNTFNYSACYNKNVAKGFWGEYASYNQLKVFEQFGARFLANVYVPKCGAEMTEIDLIMICHCGIFVIESKNYSGWIFGDENQTNWTQTLPSGRGRVEKNYFYNPIKQNQSHIEHLGNYLSEYFPVYSVVVFSDSCTLKSVTVSNPEVVIVNQSNLFSAVNWICNSARPVLSQTDIIRFYNKLYPLTQVNITVRQQHIAGVQQQINRR